MSEKMYPIPFKSLMNWIVTEYAREGEIFGVHTPYYASGKTLPIFSERIETPFGPAAGPYGVSIFSPKIERHFAGSALYSLRTPNTVCRFARSVIAQFIRFPKGIGVILSPIVINLSSS